MKCLMYNFEIFVDNFGSLYEMYNFGIFFRLFFFFLIFTEVIVFCHITTYPIGFKLNFSTELIILLQGNIDVLLTVSPSVDPQNGFHGNIHSRNG